ncbi:hypothetical protein ACVWXM_009532 [Bradyrhizobium sp. GM7.3]
MMLNTPSGKPALCSVSAISKPVNEHPGEGLKTTELPVSRAPDTMPIDNASGKLNGAITAKTP